MMYQFDTQVLHLWDFENLSSLKPDVDSEKVWYLPSRTQNGLKVVQLVGGFNPFEKYACQIGSFPQGVKI